jgi:hypothetical protein
VFSSRCDGFGSSRTSSGRNNGSFNFAFLWPSFVGLFCFITFYECIGMIALWVQLGGLFLMVARWIGYFCVMHDETDAVFLFICLPFSYLILCFSTHLKVMISWCNLDLFSSLLTLPYIVGHDICSGWNLTAFYCL